MIGLTERQNERVGKYSGGMKRRVNIGAALLHKPQVIYMDEPTVGIDPQSRRSILDSVVALKNQGMTVLYTTHYMEEAEELSDHIAIMDHGQIIASGTHAELVAHRRRAGPHHPDDQRRVPGARAGRPGRRWPGVQRVTAEDGTLTLLVDDFEPGAAAPVRGRLRRRGAHHLGRYPGAQPGSGLPAPHRPGASDKIYHEARS